jgi:hypothetical protein
VDRWSAPKLDVASSKVILQSLTLWWVHPVEIVVGPAAPMFHSARSCERSRSQEPTMDLAIWSADYHVRAGPTRFTSRRWIC